MQWVLYFLPHIHFILLFPHPHSHTFWGNYASQVEFVSSHHKFPEEMCKAHLVNLWQCLGQVTHRK
jgi:hypothetical protein